MTREEHLEVAVVGGGPAGAVTARLLAEAGHEVRVFERAPAYRWRACGVFSWTAADQLRVLGLEDELDISRVAAPVESLRLVAPDRSEVRLRAAAAAGLDRHVLDPLLLERARAAGAEVCEGAAVIAAGRRGLVVRAGASLSIVRAAFVVGADGARSVVARDLRVTARSPIGDRVGLTYHVAARPDAASTETVMIAFPGGYCGVAPVPGGRLNFGIVLDRKGWSERLKNAGAAATASAILGRVVRQDVALRGRIAGLDPLDRVAGSAPLAHAVSRVAGDGWLLAGDAAGFLDPFTGDGIGRALTTATLAADAVHRHLRGDSLGCETYAHAYRQTYADHDRLSRLVQEFVGRPPLLSYAVRRAARRPDVSATLEGVLTESIPARRGLDPRFLAALLRP